MESNEIREQLREAERAAAAPYVIYPKDPWWMIWFLSLVLPLLSIVMFQTRQGEDGVGPLLFLPSIMISGIVIFTVTVQRKRRGTFPMGEAPAELRRVYRWYFIGAAIFGVAAILIALSTPLYISVPVAFVLNLGGLFWFGASYERAAHHVRERLA